MDSDGQPASAPPFSASQRAMPDPTDPNSPPGPAPAPEPSNPPPPAAAPEPALPAAAAVVKEGKTPAELELEGKLADAQKTIKDREMSISELQDQNHQLKRVIVAPARPKKKPSRFTLLHEPED